MRIFGIGTFLKFLVELAHSLFLVCYGIHLPTIVTQYGIVNAHRQTIRFLILYECLIFFGPQY